MLLWVLLRIADKKKGVFSLDFSLFLFLQVSAFLIFFYSIERDSWQGTLIFLSTALFLALSLASFDIEKTTVLYNASSGAIEAYTVSNYDEAYGYLNGFMGLFSGALGFVKVLYYKDSRKEKLE